MGYKKHISLSHMETLAMKLLMALFLSLTTCLLIGKMKSGRSILLWLEVGWRTWSFGAIDEPWARWVLTRLIFNHMERQRVRIMTAEQEEPE